MAGPPAPAAGSSPGPLLCEVRGLGHEFPLPGGAPLRVLEDIDLTIHAGEIVALLGPSGCGKSTFLRILAGLIRPTRGEVLFPDRPGARGRRRLALVFQNFALLPWMTVAQNVEAVLRAAGLDHAAAAERADHIIRLVGLAGFEDVFPRELSGGMKQRVGIARALAVDPEILLLDEPFSQVDGLTAESLRAELLDLWAARKGLLSSVVLVSHDVREVVQMADRVVILGTNPGRIRTQVENQLPRPRDFHSPAVLNLVDQFHEIISRLEMPDAPAWAGKRPAGAFEPLPEASYSEILGLLEYLEARGGAEDVFRLAADTNREFGQIITVAKAAELLDFVSTPRRLIVLDGEGRRFVQAGPEERKAMWRERLLRLRLFREIHALLEEEPHRQIDRDFILETLVLIMPQENYETMFKTFVQWARVGDLFAYDEETQTFSLPAAV
jgi:NitT/TauT family transport system ATP-binding protein